MSVAVATFFLDIDSNGRCQLKAPMLMLIPSLMELGQSKVAHFYRASKHPKGKECVCKSHIFKYKERGLPNLFGPHLLNSARWETTNQLIHPCIYNESIYFVTSHQWSQSVIESERRDVLKNTPPRPKRFPEGGDFAPRGLDQTWVTRGPRPFRCLDHHWSDNEAEQTILQQSYRFHHFDCMLETWRNCS